MMTPSNRSSGPTSVGGPSRSTIAWTPLNRHAPRLLIPWCRAKLDPLLGDVERAVLRERGSAPGGDTRGLVSASSSSSDFLGRRAELEAFERAVEVARLGRPEVLLVGGDAGIGKSTLVLEGARRGGADIVLGLSLIHI